jgi:hypothetical protein
MQAKIFVSKDFQLNNIIIMESDPMRQTGKDTGSVLLDYPCQFKEQLLFV